MLYSTIEPTETVAGDLFRPQFQSHLRTQLIGVVKLAVVPDPLPLAWKILGGGRRGRAERFDLQFPADPHAEVASASIATGTIDTRSETLDRGRPPAGDLTVSVTSMSRLGIDDKVRHTLLVHPLRAQRGEVPIREWHVDNAIRDGHLTFGPAPWREVGQRSAVRGVQEEEMAIGAVALDQDTGDDRNPSTSMMPWTRNSSR